MTKQVQDNWKPGNGNPGGVVVMRRNLGSPEHDLVTYRVRETDNNPKEVAASDMVYNSYFVTVEVKPDIEERAKHNPKKWYFSDGAMIHKIVRYR